MNFLKKIGNFMLWIISIFFILFGFVTFIIEAFISGIILLLTGLIVNPKVRNKIANVGIKIPTGIAISSIFIGLILGVIFIPTTDTDANDKESFNTSNINPLAEEKAKAGREKKEKNDKKAKTSETKQEEIIATSNQFETSDNEKEQKEVTSEWWSNLKEPALKDEIINAFKEIGEKPEYIISIEHVKDIETDLFIRRHYKLCFDKGNILDLFDADDKHFINAVEWRIITIEWYEGEPEREQYPREYLSAIKFWKDDDSTMVLQWSQLGDGVLQEGN